MIFEKQIVNSFKGMMHTRCDDSQTVFYYSHKDFNGLNAEPYSFTASAGHKLQGYIYSYPNCIDERIIVFDHGFGGGHRAYMKEIEMLCKHGYTVFAYDHTGCMESGGESPNGMSQSLCDLNDCISTLKKDTRFSSLDISVIQPFPDTSVAISFICPVLTFFYSPCQLFIVLRPSDTFYKRIISTS